MTIDLKYLLPFFAPYLIATSIRLFWSFCGVEPDPDAIVGVSFIFGSGFGAMGLVYMYISEIKWSVRLGRKKP
jgi:hypothetical protein